MGKIILSWAAKIFLELLSIVKNSPLIHTFCMRCALYVLRDVLLQ